MLIGLILIRYLLHVVQTIWKSIHINRVSRLSQNQHSAITTENRNENISEKILHMTCVCPKKAFSKIQSPRGS